MDINCKHIWMLLDEIGLALISSSRTKTSQTRYIDVIRRQSITKTKNSRKAPLAKDALVVDFDTTRTTIPLPWRTFIECGDERSAFVRTSRTRDSPFENQTLADARS